MSASRYEPVIGLEIHAQLKTRSKLFCSCPVEFGTEPNQNVCPVCLGLPGVLPVLNRGAVRLAVRAGLALNCEIARSSRFARKHYFYPDLPKGYQITQYHEPLAQNGWLEVGGRRIRVRRLVLEEDAGKLIHLGAETLIDFNRCGVPLIEVVTEPDIRSPEEAYQFLVKLRQLLRYLDVCGGDMEKGEFRCEPNVSLCPEGEGRMGVRTEIKNLNSLRSVRDAISFEIERQARILGRGEEVVQQTMLWDEVRGRVEPMRVKEEAADYRYFPEPDLPPLSLTEAEVEGLRAELSELPWVRSERFEQEFGLARADAELLTSSRGLADYYEELVKLGIGPGPAANWVRTEVLRVLNEQGIRIEEFPVPPEGLSELLKLLSSGRITTRVAKEVFYEMVRTGKGALQIVSEEGMERFRDDGLTAQVVEEVLAQNPAVVEKYRKGKATVLGFLVGEAMKRSRGRLDPKAVAEEIRARLG